MGDVVHLRSAPLTGELVCAQCGAGHAELGVLCVACRALQQPIGYAYLQATVATTILDLQRWEKQGNPLSGHLASVMTRMRQMYDSVTLRVQLAAPGEIRFLEGEFWAYPTGSDSALGAFPSSEAAEAALVQFAADHPEAE